MGLLLQGGSANIADVQFEGGAGNKTVTIPKEGGRLAVGTMLSGLTAYHLLQGDLSVSNEVITNGAGVYTYTGNTTVLPTVSLGMDIESQWGNDATEKYGYLIIIKSRSASGVWSYVNSIRGRTKYTDSSTTGAEGTDANMFTLSTVGGNTTVNIGTSTRTNVNGVTYSMEVYQTTHIKTYTTNHNKTAIEHYNMFTGFTIENYEGSGLAGHDLLHSLGRKLGFVINKNLTATANWNAQSDLQIASGKYMKLNSNDGELPATTLITDNTESKLTVGTDGYVNTSTNQYIMYGWTNSYFDESGKLIGIFEIGVYQGGSAGNKITTRNKLARLEIKRLDLAGEWMINDILRYTTKGALYANLPAAEDASSTISFQNDGFSHTITYANGNTSGGQYLYFSFYDNDSGSGKSKYPRATDTSNIQVNNAIIPFANGVDSSGTKVSTIAKNESITGLTYTAGKNYVYALENGTYGVKPYRPRYLRSDLVAEKAGDNPDYFDVLSNTWYSTNVATSIGNTITLNAPITARNYLDTIAYADASGQLTYVEELPKTQYFDRIETGSNRKVMYLADYGIAQIQNNKRYVLDNPFGNDSYMDCDVKVELYRNNMWFGVNGLIYASGGYGVNGHSQLEGIVLQTGSLAVCSNNFDDGNGSGISGVSISAPARVIIQFNGKTGGTR